MSENITDFMERLQTNHRKSNDKVYAIKKINAILRRYGYKPDYISDEISGEQLLKAKKDLEKDREYLKLNNAGNDMYSLVLGWFADYLSVKNSAVTLLKKKKQAILYGPPGTGKTRNTMGLAVRIIAENT